MAIFCSATPILVDYGIPQHWINISMFGINLPSPTAAAYVNDIKCLDTHETSSAGRNDRFHQFKNNQNQGSPARKF